MIDLIIIVVACYLIGSFPTGVIVGKIFRHIDIRKHGSGNTGATNTFRVLGAKAGFPVAVIDFLKGLAATLFIARLQLFSEPLLSVSWMYVIVTLAVVLGHVKPVFAGFKGGKGFGTAAGAVTGMVPLIAPFCLLCFLIFLVLSGNVAFSAVFTALFLPLCYFLLSVWAEISLDPVIFGFFIFTFMLTFVMIRKKFFQYLRGESENFTKIMLFKRKKGKE
ncbi:MAG: glycerol-3-phosphate 1-O-acyltransferase PlsY [Candidatus Marinimicrobia bacterium]|nr:glycerol-3-phosphate 1-O-acyltransferase PlsY [Candidatus Neomarinimicrobiota bacterium]